MTVVEGGGFEPGIPNLALRIAHDPPMEWFAWRCLVCDDRGVYHPPISYDDTDTKKVDRCDACGASVFSFARPVGFVGRQR